jgi:hypothetical protein
LRIGNLGFDEAKWLADDHIALKASYIASQNDYKTKFFDVILKK